ncbi:MAG: mannose-1-phosphate guanylyltransferase/mannose-6-phosphate isomerase [Myxococcales bacterium]|nr:mannose-1-phosphate guanylyltransferase/mannose-6-phosphate isomerase [Myxococcales bacterium]
MLVPLVLSGGSGTRLWPLSRPLHPKQLLPLSSDQTMLQQTAARLEGLADLAAPVVVCNARHQALVQAQLRELGRPAQAVILEPTGRNTAPAVALAALHVLEGADADADPLLLVLPADHVVLDPAAFRAAVDRGRSAAREGKLVTFGVIPERPETGYGYIRAASSEPVAPIARFVEKPDRATAQAYLEAGDYYWNSGMFLLCARRYVDELRRFAPAMVEACTQALARADVEGPVVHVDPEAWEACPADSIDYAVMEKTADGVVIPMSVGWSDVGSWSALHDVRPRDEAGNTLVGDVVAVDCQGSFVLSSHRLVTAAGLRDTVVVETEDAVLVVPRDRSQDVKTVVERLSAAGRPEAVGPRAQVTPWGTYRHVEELDGSTVWHITIDGGHQTPPEQHAAWDRRLVVVAGAGALHHDDGREPVALQPGQSVLLPAGTGYHLSGDEGPGLRLLAIDLPPAP